MKNWEVFESDCCNYLNNQFGSNSRVFQHRGGSDSTESDILYIKGGINQFYIEVKMKASQCGQFVLLPDFEQRKLVFSNRNKVKETENCIQIINAMNKDFDYYSSSSLNIKQMPDSPESAKIYSGWIKDCFRAKNAKYIISRSNRGFIVFPVNQLEQYFRISPVFRVKKSGSTNLPHSMQSPLEKTLQEKFGNNINLDYSENHCFLYGASQPTFQLKIGSNVFLFKKEEGRHAVRKLSNTFNSNVIFTLNLFGEQQEKDIEQFKNEI